MLSWGMLSFVPVNSLSGPHNNRHKNCPDMSCCKDFSEVYIKLSKFSLQGPRKKGSFNF